MRKMGEYFEPPRRNNYTEWERLRLLADNRFTCHTEGGIALVRCVIKNRSSIRNLKKASRLKGLIVKKKTSSTEQESSKNGRNK